MATQEKQTYKPTETHGWVREQYKTPSGMLLIHTLEFFNVFKKFRKLIYAWYYRQQGICPKCSIEAEIMNLTNQYIWKNGKKHKLKPLKLWTCKRCGWSKIRRV